MLTVPYDRVNMAVPTRVQKDTRVTIPVDIRRNLNLTRGDYILIEVQLFNPDDIE